MRKTPLRRRSARTEAWAKLYRNEKALRIAAGEVCQDCKSICGILDGHHYAGSRRNENVLRFTILGRACHDQTNAVLRSKGLLAEVNGTFSVAHPAVTAGEARQQELLQTLVLP